MNSSSIERYITFLRLRGDEEKGIVRKERELQRFLDSAGKSPGGITEEDVTRYLESVPFPRSTPRRFSVIRQYFAFLVREGELLLNPAENFVTEKIGDCEIRGLFSEEEIVMLIDSIPHDDAGKRDRAIIELMYSSGLRISELSGLDEADIDPRSQEVYVRQGKWRKERLVPVGEKALVAVNAYLKVREKLLERGREHEALFLGVRGNRLTASGIRKVIHHRKGKAGIDTKGNAHALRHSCATHLLHRGAPIESIRRLLGHRSLVSTQRYTHLRERYLKRGRHGDE